jgi:hypothetical protein
MRFATTQEMEYLGSMDRDGAKEKRLIHEMSRQLDALRRFDQYFCDADWQPACSRQRTRGHSTNNP